MKNKGRFKYKNTNPPWQFPKEPMTTWDMGRDYAGGVDFTPNPGINKRFEKSPYELAKKAITCRLLISKYSRSQAKERCMEIHGTVFDGLFSSGRFFVFWKEVAV